jgi:hypothetical protein
MDVSDLVAVEVMTNALNGGAVPEDSTAGVHLHHHLCPAHEQLLCCLGGLVALHQLIDVHHGH